MWRACQRRRKLAVIVLSATPDLGRAFVERMLILNAATGALTEEKRGVLGDCSAAVSVPRSRTDTGTDRSAAGTRPKIRIDVDDERAIRDPPPCP